MTFATQAASPGPAWSARAGPEPTWFSGGMWAFGVITVALIALRLATLRDGLWVDNEEVIGADFATFWSAARLVASGHILTVFDIHGFDLAQRAMIGRARQFAFWSYPPPTLFLYLPFAALPYLAAYGAWMIASLAAFAPVARAWLRSNRDAMLVLICPAVGMGALVGQNGPVTAALLLGGLLLVERRPWLAGAVLGLLAIKPQTALLLPVAVIAGRHWRVMGGAAASVAVLALASVAVFGIEPWRAFAAHTLPAQSSMLEHGEGWFQWAMPTAFMAARLLGAPWQAAMLVQAPFLLFGAALVWRAWRSGAALEDKAIVLVLAGACASPQLFNYDLVAFCAALLLWVRRDPRPASFALALVGWTLPALCIVLSGFHVPLSPLLLAAIAWRASRAPGALTRQDQPNRSPRYTRRTSGSASTASGAPSNSTSPA